MQDGVVQDTYSSFYNKKFPASLQENFQTEAASLWQEIEQDLMAACRPSAPDFDLFLALVPKLEIFLTIYGPSQERKEMLATLLLKLLLEEKTTTVINVIIIRLLLITMGSGKTCGNMKNLRLNWKALYGFLEEVISGPVANLAVGTYTPKGRLINEVTFLIKKVRVLYPEDSIEEVLKTLRKDFNPFLLSGYKGTILLNLFINVDLGQKGRRSPLGQEYYEKKIIPELLALWRGRRYQWEAAYMIVLGRIARKYPKIDWTPHYDQLFTAFFDAIKAEFPQKSGSGRNSTSLRGTAWTALISRRSDAYYVPDLLVRILKPMKAKGGAECWENLDRIYKSTLPFIHPENTGGWSRSLAEFYDEFCELYIKRALREQRKTERRMARTKAKESSDNKEVILEDRQNDKEVIIEDRQHDKEDEGEDFEPVDEVDLGLLDDKDDEEHKEEDVPNEEEDHDEDEQADQEDEASGEGEKREKTGEKVEYKLDEACHAKFMEMMVYVLKNFIYMRDGRVVDHVAKTCRRLLFFRPEEFAPQLLKMIYSLFDRSDMDHIGFVKILLLSVYPLLNRRYFKKGLYELPRILEMTLEHVTAHDMSKTRLVLEFYEMTFSQVPIYHPDDLKEKYQSLYGITDIKAIKAKLNEGEESDLWQLSEDLSDWAVRFFRKLVDIIIHFERPQGSANCKTTALVASYKDLHSFIFQSSPRLIQKYLDIIRSYLEANLQKPPSQYLNDILYPLNLRDANSTLSKLLPLFKDQLITKLPAPNSEANAKKPLYSLVQNSSVAAIFDQYELNIINKETLVRVLVVLQDLLTFSSPAVLKHRQDIELIIFHCLLHEEYSVFERASQLFHTLLLSLLSIYPTNLGSLNPQDLTPEEFNNMYKNVGRLSRKNIEVEWHMPSEEEKQYAKEIYTLLFDKNLSEIESQYLQGITAKKPDIDTLASLIDDMHLKKADLSNVQRENLARSLSLVNLAFLGVSQRASYAGIAELSEEKKKFEEKFTLDVCNGARQRLCDIGNRLVQYTFSNLYIRDPSIARNLVQLIETMYGEDEQHDELHRRMRTLRQMKRVFELEGMSKEMYENRCLMVLHIGLKLQERVLGHSADTNYKENAQEMLFIVWLFSFHSDVDVSRLALKVLRRRASHLKPQNKNELFAQLSEYTANIVNERFSFLRDNAKDLEKNKVIMFKQNEIIYNNRDSYVDVLLKGALFNLEYLLPYVTINLQYLFQFIRILLDVPKIDDPNFLIRFSRLINGIDFSPYIADDLKEEEKERIILKTNELYEQYEQSAAQKDLGPKKVFYDQAKLMPHVEESMDRVINGLTQKDANWKYQVVAAFTGALLSRFLSPKSELLSKFIVCVFKQISSEHYYLRYFATSAFPALLKMHTEEFRKDTEIQRNPEDFKGLKLSLDEAFKYHFIKKEDYQNNYIKDPYIGILDHYEELEVDNLKQLPKTDLSQEFTEEIQGKDFLRKVIMNLVSDVPSQEEVAQRGGTGGIAGLLGRMAFNFKGFIGEFFRLSSHKKGKAKSFATITSLFSLIEASLLRALLKYFDGPKVFENSIELIEELARDYSSREKQVVAAHYFYAAFKTFKFWDQASAEKATTRLSEILCNALDNLSPENYNIWNTAFSNAIHHLDIRLLKPFLDKILQNPFEKKLANIQGRYLSLYESIIDRNGVFSEEIAERFLDLLATFKPTETRQVEHIKYMIFGLLVDYVLNPVNYHKLKEEGVVDNIEGIIQANSQDFILEDNYFLYKFNKKLDKVLENYAQWAKEATSPDENKIYFELLFTITRSFHSRKITYSLYKHYEKTILFLLNLNSDESLSLNLHSIQALKDSIMSLSKLHYPLEALPVIGNALETCIKAKSPKVRENALKFYHYFSFNHLFYLKKRANTIDLVVDSLLDENPAVKNEAFDAVTDIITFYTENEIKETIDKYKKLVDDNKPKKNVDNVTKGLYVLMSVVLSRPYEIEEWTESVLEYLFANKKHSKPASEKFNKDFAVKFWDNHKGRANVNERALSYEVYSDLREIGNPSSYFA